MARPVQLRRRRRQYRGDHPGRRRKRLLEFLRHERGDGDIISAGTQDGQPVPTDGFINDTFDFIAFAETENGENIRAQFNKTRMVKLPDSAPDVSGKRYRLMLLSVTLDGMGNGSSDIETINSQFNSYVNLTSNTADALRQAMDTFWRNGYAATSLTDLLEATGLSKSSLYGTFGGKHELFVKAFDAYRKERALSMRRILENGSARQAIERFFRGIATDVEDGTPSRGCMSINPAVEMAPRDDGIRTRVLHDFELMEEALTGTIERGQAEGSIPPGKRARDLARLLVLAFPGLQVQVRAGADRAQLDDTLNLLLSSLD